MKIKCIFSLNGEKILITHAFFFFDHYQGFHAEVHQYKPHVEELNEITRSLINVYQNDDATKIKKISEEINRR